MGLAPGYGAGVGAGAGRGGSGEVGQQADATVAFGQDRRLAEHVGEGFGVGASDDPGIPDGDQLVGADGGVAAPYLGGDDGSLPAAAAIGTAERLLLAAWAR